MSLQRGRSGFPWGRLPIAEPHLPASGGEPVLPVSTFASGLASDDDPHPYPGERPRGSFVVLGDEVLPLRWECGEWRVRSRDREATPLSSWLDRHGQASLGERSAILAYGSNVNPHQIGVFARGRAVVVMQALTVGMSAVFCSTRRHDGQHPAGLMADDAQRVELHGLLLVDDDQVADLDRKEGHGVRYLRGTVSGEHHSVAVLLENGRAIVDEITTYVQLNQRPLALINGVPARLTDWSQAEFEPADKRDTHDHGFSVQESDAEALNARVLPVFVYGTLRPGESRWPYVRDVVESTEDAAVVGRVFDTGLGYPALALDGSTRVAGVLLHLAASTADDAMALLDEIEAHPNLYVRTLVRLVDGRLAWTYVWNGPPA